MPTMQPTSLHVTESTVEGRHRVSASADFNSAFAVGAGIIPQRLRFEAITNRP
jgi:hypothetical protein